MPHGVYVNRPAPLIPLWNAGGLQVPVKDSTQAGRDDEDGRVARHTVRGGPKLARTHLEASSVALVAFRALNGSLVEPDGWHVASGFPEGVRLLRKPVPEISRKISP